MTLNLNDSLGDWLPILQPEFDKEYMKIIGQRLQSEMKCCPKPENIFNAYRLTQPSKVKVCVLGMDPYHTPGMAHGLSFSTLGTKLPPSLRIIFDELVDSGLSPKRRTKLDLTDWAEQGVLMLNTILTTREGNARAHGTWGWQIFTGKTIEYLAMRPELTVFLAWGNDAIDTIKKYSSEGQNNIVLTSPHPAAQLYGGLKKFIGNRHFLHTNEFLVKAGLTPIEWHGK